MTNTKKKLIYGKNSVIDALKNKINFKSLLITPNNIGYIKNNFPKIKFIISNKEELNKLTNNNNHQGFCLIIENEVINYKDINLIFKNKVDVVIYIEHIEDPRNLGALIRTINACGFKDVILSERKSCKLNDVALKTSCGGFIGINFYKTNSSSSLIDKFKKNNYWIYSSAILENAKNCFDANYNFPLLIIFGNEGKGVSKTIINSCDQLIYIPMNGTVQSLNVSVASGIILFDIKNKLNS